MKKQFFTTASVIAFFHCILAVVLVIAAVGSGMEAFDNPAYKASVMEWISDFFYGLIMQPGISLWTPWVSRNLPDSAQWILFAINSGFWGICLAAILNTSSFYKDKVR